MGVREAPNDTLSSKRVPEDWKQGQLVRIAKKGGLSLFQNYRGIML